MTTTDQADLICELRAGARELDAQHALNLAAGVLHDLVNDRRGQVTPEIAAALGAARVAAYGTHENDPDWTVPR